MTFERLWLVRSGHAFRNGRPILSRKDTKTSPCGGAVDHFPAFVRRRLSSQEYAVRPFGLSLVSSIENGSVKTKCSLGFVLEPAWLSIFRPATSAASAGGSRLNVNSSPFAREVALGDDRLCDIDNGRAICARFYLPDVKNLGKSSATRISFRAVRQQPISVTTQLNARYRTNPRAGNQVLFAYSNTPIDLNLCGP